MLFLSLEAYLWYFNTSAFKCAAIDWGYGLPITTEMVIGSKFTRDGDRVRKKVQIH